MRGPRSARPNYKESEFGMQAFVHKQAMLDDPEGKLARMFRRRFRVPPWLFFNVLVPECKPIFDVHFTYIPIEIKVMIALRILGRDACADDCAELSFVHESTANRIFHKFITEYPKLHYEKYVYFPDPGTKEHTDAKEAYRKLGFPGQAYSIDGTKVPWDKCDKENKWRCHGREGYPTVSFQVACDHSRKIYYISPAFCGAENDITTVKKCDDLLDVIFEKYKDVEYILFDEFGNAYVVIGLWGSTDNGFPRWPQFPRPIQSCRNNIECFFRELIESDRKDIECVFGITKSRFRFLKNAVRYHKPETHQLEKFHFSFRFFVPRRVCKTP
jgi:hypothetical protein